MAKRSKNNIVLKLFVLVCIFIIAFSSSSGLLGQVLGFHDYTTYDRGGGGPHVVKVPDAGDAIKIPTEFGQSTDDFEAYHQNWGGVQRKIYDKWVSDGETHSDRHWAYLNVGGKPRYLVALAPIFGVTGDYVDIYITHNGEQKIYPCLIADEKDIWYDPAFTYNGKAYGHVGSNNTCKIIEVCTELAGVASNYSLMTPLLNDMKDITQIVNGGSWLQHPEGPIGLEGPYNYDDGTTSGGESTDGDDEAETFTGALNMFFRNLWDSTATSFENSVNDRNDTSVLYDINNLSGSSGSNSSSNISNASGITDAQVKAIYDEYLKNKGKPYRQDHSNLSYDKCMDYYDCSSWTIHCLAHAGIKKLPDSTAAGLFELCEKVNESDKKPGDLIFLQNTYTTGISHVGIYLGSFTIDGETAEWITDTGGNRSGGVKISKYNNGWWNGEHFYSFGRLKN